MINDSDIIESSAKLEDDFQPCLAIELKITKEK